MNKPLQCTKCGTVFAGGVSEASQSLSSGKCTVCSGILGELSQAATQNSGKREWWLWLSAAPEVGIAVAIAAVVAFAIK